MQKVIVHHACWKYVVFLKGQRGQDSLHYNEKLLPQKQASECRCTDIAAGEAEKKLHSVSEK